MNQEEEVLGVYRQHRNSRQELINIWWEVISYSICDHSFRRVLGQLYYALHIYTILLSLSIISRQIKLIHNSRYFNWTTGILKWKTQQDKNLSLIHVVEGIILKFLR